MFKKFTKDDIHSQTQAKSSVQRNIRAKIVEQIPGIEEFMDDIMPKKQPIKVVKCLDKISIIESEGRYLFFETKDSVFVPSLKLLHKYPDILPKMQVDAGAIKFVLNGADIMCQGLTSNGGSMAEVSEGVCVAIYAEGKDTALGLGITKMSTEKIKSVNKGIGVLNLHFLNDQLWEILSKE